jgi:hypothetical protein
MVEDYYQVSTHNSASEDEINLQMTAFVNRQHQKNKRRNTPSLPKFRVSTKAFESDNMDIYKVSYSDFAIYLKDVDKTYHFQVNKATDHYDQQVIRQVEICYNNKPVIIYNGDDL